MTEHQTIGFGVPGDSSVDSASYAGTAGMAVYALNAGGATAAVNAASASYVSSSHGIIGSLTASFISASVISASSLYMGIFKATVSTMSVGYLEVTQVIDGTASLANSASYVPASGIDVFKSTQDGTGAGGLLLAEHFLAPTTALINTFASTVSGTSAAITIVTGSLGHPGVIQQSTGTTGAGRTSTVSHAACILFGAGTYVFESEVRLPLLSSAAQRYTFYVGFGDVSAAGDMTNGAYFQYVDSASTFWQIKTASASTRTTTTTNVTVVAGTWYKLRIVVTDTAEADFYINDALVGTITTNIPAIVGRETGLIVKIEKSVGTTASTSLIDYIKLAYK